VNNNYIMVLNDGETFTNLDGCTVVKLPEGIDSIEQIEEFLALSSSYDRDEQLTFEKAVVGGYEDMGDSIRFTTRIA
jgi:hypothetical protein